MPACGVSLRAPVSSFLRRASELVRTATAERAATSLAPQNDDGETYTQRLLKAKRNVRK